MFDVPDPFHAAVVHFPIVFIFVGTALALLTIFWKRAYLPQYAALFMILAAGSAQYAVMTGQDQENEIIKAKPAAKTMIEHHAEWGQLTWKVSAAAALCALLSLLFVRSRGFRRVLPIVTTLVGLGACYCVIAAGERGGEMVFQHGIGVQVEPAKPAATPSPPQ